MDRAKSYADANRSFREFEEGENVFLKVPSHSKSLISEECTKLSPRYCGPWLILKRIGKVAYKLELPQGCRVHPVFHVSRLKKFLHPGDSLIEGIVLFQEIEDNARRKPTRILDRGVCKYAIGRYPRCWLHCMVYLYLTLPGNPYISCGEHSQTSSSRTLMLEEGRNVMLKPR